MSALKPIHQVSSDEDEEEELDLASRVRKRFEEKSESIKIPSQTKTNTDVIQDIREFVVNTYKIHEISDDDDDLPDIQDITLSPKKDFSGSTDKVQPTNLFKTTMFPKNSIGSDSTKYETKNNEAKLSEKEAKKKERERKKEEKEYEKRKKQEEKLLKKAFRPGECLRYISVQIDRHLLEVPEGSEIISKLLEVNVQYKAEDQIIENSISYLRKDPISGDETDEKEVIVIIKIDDFFSQVCNQTRGTVYDAGNTLMSKCKFWKEITKDSRITIVICGIEEFFKKQKANTRKNSQENISNHEDASKGKRPRKKRKIDETPSYISQISRIDIEMALLTAQMELDVNSRFFENPSKIADFVAQVAKSIAEKPYKLEKAANNFTWYAEGSNVNCVKIGKSGEGLLKLWHQQLRQFNNVGPEASQAIAKKYPSPQSLIKAYRELSEEEGQKLLADIPVRRGVGVLVNTRRIGPELSKKIYNFFMCEDPDVLL